MARQRSMLEVEFRETALGITGGGNHHNNGDEEREVGKDPGDGV